MGDRLTLDYGVRFYYLTPQWDTSLQASNFLPDSYVEVEGRPPLPAGRRRRRARGLRRRRRARRSTPPSSAAWCRAPATGSRGRSRPARASTTRSPTATSSRCRRALGFAYDITGRAVAHRPRRLRDLLRPAAGQPGVRPDHEPARPAVDDAALGPGERGRRRDRRPVRPGRPQPERRTTGRRPTVYQWNLGVQWKMPADFVLDVSYVGSESRNLLQTAPDQRLAVRHDLPGVEPGSDPRPDVQRAAPRQHAAGRQRPADRLPASATRGTAASACGSSRPTRTTRPCRRPSAAASQGPDVLGQLHAQLGQGHRRRRLGRRPHRRQGPGSQLRSARSGPSARLRA